MTLAITWRRRHYGNSRSRSNHETSRGAGQSERRRPRTWDLQPQRQFTVRPEPPAEPWEPTLGFLSSLSGSGDELGWTETRKLQFAPINWDIGSIFPWLLTLKTQEGNLISVSIYRYALARAHRGLKRTRTLWYKATSSQLSMFTCVYVWVYRKTHSKRAWFI